MVNDEMFEKIKNDIILDSERHEEFHKTALVTSAKGINSNVEETKRVLLKMNIYLFEPKYHNDYFITSDNPGFSLLKGKVFNTNFGDFDSVGFPINSKQFIFFHGKSVQSEFEIRRAINYQKATSKEVDQFNYYTMQNSFEYVFCESKSYLKYITEKLHEGL
jgi:hypothetical protein